MARPYLPVIVTLIRPVYRRPERALSGLLLCAGFVFALTTPEELSSSVSAAAFATPVRPWAARPADSARNLEAAFRVAYYDLYHEKLTLRDGSRLESIVESPHTQLVWRLNDPSWTVGASLNTDSYYASHADWHEQKAVNSFQSLRSLGVVLWKHSPALSMGLYIGKVFGENIAETTDSGDLVPLQPATFLSLNPTINYGALVEARWRVWTWHASALRYLAHASVNKITQLSNDNFRSMPLAAAAREFSLGAQRRWPRITAGLAAELQMLESDRLMVSDNSLPNDMDMVMRTITTDGSVEMGKACADWQAWYRSGGGYLAGYSDRFNYLLVDSASARTVGGIAHLHLPLQIHTGVFGEYWKAEAPTGFIHMSPFSAWTIFDPVKYRLHDMRLRAYEAGAMMRRPFSLGSHNQLIPDVSFSYVKARARLERDERQLVVWIPIYVNDTTITAFDVRGYVLGAMLAHTLTIRRVSLTTRVRQRIPFLEYRHKEGVSAGEDPTEGAAVEHRYGGTEYRLTVTYSR